jgi:hypothetical protein
VLLAVPGQLQTVKAAMRIRGGHMRAPEIDLDIKRYPALERIKAALPFCGAWAKARESNTWPVTA